VRIISGRFRGKILVAPKQLPVRPTTDFAKTGIFNILANYFDFEEVNVLDLFCGTGNISYEFGSRGCTHLVAVDENSHCVKFVSETFKKLDMPEAKTIRADVFRFLETCNTPFDIIFADPPYELETTDRIPELVFKKKLLNKDGWLIIEHQSKRKLESIIQPGETRAYGNCSFSIFKNKILSNG
jgi:16S rRNA (guanine966-N2)-methyltransferase